MSRITFTIKLTSDGEPASGFGTILKDSLLPRDIHQNIIIPGSHLKGLMRENLEKSIGSFVPKFVLDTLFGNEGACNGALFHIDNATTKNATILDISRTKMNQFGTADQGSLRTSEAVAVGTEFKGSIQTRDNISEAYVKLLKLGLLSIFAVGGNRNRGAGSCYVTIDGEINTPGQILHEITNISKWDPLSAVDVKSSTQGMDTNRQVTLKLVFKAKNSICVPEIPIIANNIIKSGFTIPASAVQGAILHRLNDISEEVATACYESTHFRAWPLNPTNSENYFSFRVSMTHKLSKQADSSGRYHFEDELVRQYDWDKIPPNSPLKSSDGVLLSDGETVKLWKSSDMARVITAHGVINGNRKGGQKRNIYTIEALAPTIFTGLVSMPESAAVLLKKSLTANPFVTLGKSRSVRGGGELSVQDIQFDSIKAIKKSSDVFIVQSPLLVPIEDVNNPFGSIMKKLAKEYGFGEVNASSGTIITRFGWDNTVHGGRLAAVAVIAPGSVFRLNQPVDDLVSKLIAGIGEGRKRGLGAVMPHPGIAQTIYPDIPEPKKMKKIKNFGKEGFTLWEKARSSDLSASQISRVRELVGLDSNKAIAYLERQKTDRPEIIWQRWQSVIEEMKTGIRTNAEYYFKVLKVCQDLLVADKGE